MKKEEILDNISNLSSIPITVIEKDKIVYQTVKHPCLTELLRITPKELIETKKPLYCVQTDFELNFGYLKISDFSYAVFGPVSELSCDNARAHAILKKYGLPLSDFSAVKDYFTSTPRLWIFKLAQVLAFSSYLIRGKYIDNIQSILPENLIFNPDERQDKKAEDNADFQIFHGDQDYERMLFSFVASGQQYKLKEFLENKNFAGTPGELSHDVLRSYKNLIIVSIGLAERAAVRGGLPYETSLNFGDVYIRKVEYAKNAAELLTLLHTFLLTITRLVAEAKLSGADTALATKVKKYVEENLNNPISVTSIAEKLGISVGYLSVQFKKETGFTVNEYVVKSKIDEAKRLLSLKDNTIIYISNQLSFSSQSYFQTVFKKYTGLTPKEYRKKYHADMPF